MDHLQEAKRYLRYGGRETGEDLTREEEVRRGNVPGAVRVQKSLPDN